MRTLAPALLALAVACGPAQVDMALDLDEDGLLDESEWGSDPQNPDSDGDGFEDGFEVSQERDPMDATSFPYIGGWLIDTECNDELAATGNGEGEVAEDFAIVDQYGQEFRFHDFCNRSILLEMSGFS
jgi:hypothetical protein